MDLGPEIYFLFGISGFATVWAYRYVTKSKKTGEFEYLSLSILWGVILLGVAGIVWKNDVHMRELLGNPYSAGVILAPIGLFVGLAGGPAIKFIKWVFKWIKRFFMVPLLMPPKKKK